MTWDERIAQTTKIVDLAIKAEAHAFLLLLIGCGMTVKGQATLGQGLVMTALGIFKGKSSN